MTAAQIAEHQARIKGGANKNSNSSSVAHLEQRAGNGAQGANEPEATLPCVIIRFTHYRRRAADVDNFATKWFIDALVKNRVLRNDTPEEVEEVRHRQVIIEQWEEERTELELIEA